MNSPRWKAWCGSTSAKSSIERVSDLGWVGSDEIRASCVPQDHTGRKLNPVAVPALGFEAGEEKFAGIHQARRDLIPVARKVAEFFTTSGKDGYRVSVVRDFDFAAQHQVVAYREGSLDVLHWPAAGARNVGLHEEDFLGERRRRSTRLHLGVQQGQLVFLDGSKGVIVHNFSVGEELIEPVTAFVAQRLGNGDAFV